MLLLDEGQEGRLGGRRNLIPEMSRDWRHRRHINMLRPVEARTSSGRERLHQEIWPAKDGTVKVAGQIARYTRQLQENHSELAAGYRQYVNLLVDFCGVEIPVPDAIDEQVDLLITDFDSMQLQTINEKLLPALGDGFRTNRRGSLRGVSQNTLANWWGERGG